MRLKTGNYLIGGILVLIFFGGCQYLTGPNEEEAAKGEPIAKVADNYLYAKDLDGLLTDGTTLEDSSSIVRSYVDNWVRKQLLINKAQEAINFNEAELERKVLDYKYALMVHEYEKLKVNEALSTEVSDEEINQYYEEKYENFLLKQNIVKCIFAKVPEDAPDISEFSKMLRKYPKSEFKDIKSYCLQFADKFSLEDSTWVNFDDIIQNTHLAGIPNKIQFLKNNKYVESNNEGNVYFLRILDYKISEEVSPLSFIKSDIRNIIINKRKVTIKKNLKEEIFNEARSKNEFEIYKN
ncbi:MAG: peptidyl-prolyl cis-trans isomerase [Cyclobacteriaceae bacterium]